MQTKFAYGTACLDRFATSLSSLELVTISFDEQRDFGGGHPFLTLFIFVLVV